MDGSDLTKTVVIVKLNQVDFINIQKETHIAHGNYIFLFMIKINKRCYCPFRTLTIVHKSSNYQNNKQTFIAKSEFYVKIKLKIPTRRVRMKEKWKWNFYKYFLRYYKVNYCVKCVRMFISIHKIEWFLLKIAFKRKSNILNEIYTA